MPSDSVSRPWMIYLATFFKLISVVLNFWENDITKIISGILLGLTALSGLFSGLPGGMFLVTSLILAGDIAIYIFYMKGNIKDLNHTVYEFIAGIIAFYWVIYSVFIFGTAMNKKPLIKQIVDVSLRKKSQDMSSFTKPEKPREELLEETSDEFPEIKQKEEEETEVLEEKTPEIFTKNEYEGELLTQRDLLADQSNLTTSDVGKLWMETGVEKENKWVYLEKTEQDVFTIAIWNPETRKIIASQGRIDDKEQIHNDFNHPKEIRERDDGRAKSPNKFYDTEIIIKGNSTEVNDNSDLNNPQAFRFSDKSVEQFDPKEKQAVIQID